MSKKLMAIFTISILAAIAVPMAFGTSSAPTPTIPSECTLGYHGTWTLTINIKMTVKNDEDTGFIGYWALDNYVKSVYIWEGPTVSGVTSWCILQQYSGTFKTFAGALSPQNGVKEPNNGGGTMLGGIVYNFTTTSSDAFLGPYCPSHCSGTASSEPLTGSIGTYNFGGTQSDILLGSYTNGQVGDTSYISYVEFYFANPSSIAFNALQWSFSYRLGNGQGYGNLWFNGDYYTSTAYSSFGDIIT